MTLDSLAKRLLFFGRVILVTSLVSLVTCLQKIDAIDLRRDVVDLSLLGNLEEIASPEEILQPSPVAHDEALRWIDETRPQAAKQLHEARKKVTEWLQNAGESDSDLSILAGKSGSVGRLDRKTTPFYFLELSIDKGMMNSLSVASQRKRPRTVDEFINKLDMLTAQTSIAFVVRIEEPLPEVEHHYVLRSALLRGQNLEVSLVEKLPPTAQQQALTETHSFPVKTAVAEHAPSLLRLGEADRRENSELEALAGEEKRRAKLVAIYGLLPIEEAKAVASKGLTDAYQSINIFGFAFSTQRFPFAVLGFLSLATAGTLATLRAANQQSLRVITDFSDADVMDLFLEHYLGRTILWIFLPLLALGASLPQVPIPAFQRNALIVAAVMLLIAGVCCILQSRRV